MMKRLTILAAAAAIAATTAGGAFAGSKIQPLPVKKSTQAAPTSLGGLGAGASTALIAAGVITAIVVIANSSSSTGT